MQCDRAQEFFSEYLERTLDRPMTVALESHLAACGGCRDEIEGLRDLFVTLETVPQVEPPADGAWQVIRAIQEERAKQVEAERRRAPGFLDWLRGLSPASAAMGAGLATLIIGGPLVATRVPHTQLGPGAVPPPSVPVAAASPSAPAVHVTMGQPTDAGQLVHFHVRPTTTLVAPTVRVTNGGMVASWDVKGKVTPETLTDFPVNLARGTSAEALRLTVGGGGQEYVYTVVVPLTTQRGQPVTLTLLDQPLDAALRQLAPYLGYPVVADGSLQGEVDLQVVEAQPKQCLEELARAIGATVRFENRVYRLTAAGQ